MIRYSLILIVALSLFQRGESLAGYIAANLNIEKIRSADELETHSAGFSIHVDWVDLTLGSNSVAVLSHQIGGAMWSNAIPVYHREDRGIFGCRIPFEDVSDANGDWTCIINGGTAPHEILSFTVTNIETTIFPPFPPFPQLHYEGVYSNVFMTFASTIEYGVSLSLGAGYSGYSNVTGGRVYSYIDGGPYRIDITHQKIINSIPVYNSDDEVEVVMEYPYANSKINSTIFIGQSENEFSLDIEQASASYRITCMGLATGVLYQLRTSTDLLSWTNYMGFTGPGNALIIEPDMTSPRQFFMLAH